MKWLRKLLWPFSLLYAAGVYLRNMAYDYGVFPSRSFAVPVLCVGNLSVGGSGKTPMVEWLLRQLPGRNVAVLSRGYGRKSKGFLYVHPESGAAEVGDEPLQVSRNFPGVTVAVDANRTRGIETLIREKSPDLIILDDGFQHRKVRPSASILLTPYDALYPDQGYLPSGDLRDHRSQARRAQVIVVTKCPEHLTPEDRQRVIARLRPNPEQQVLFAHLAYQEVRDPNGQSVEMKLVQETALTLVTGIARPAPLVAYLKSKGLTFQHFEYPDHHRFRKAELAKIRSAGQALTTEKDAVRLQAYLKNYWVLGVQHHFESEDRERLLEFLRRV